MVTYSIAYIVNESEETPIWPGIQEDMLTPHRVIRRFNRSNYWSPRDCYQQLLDMCSSEIIIYMHSDVVIHDDSWKSRVLGHFTKRDVVAVGLGGATGLGNSDLYRKKYAINNLARSGYCCNQYDAEVHGERLEGNRRVVVLDAFFMAIRTDWLKPKGWPENLTHHCLDLWIACEATRDKKQIYVEGCDCIHKGGAMSVGEQYKKARWLQGGTTDSDHAIPHRWLFDNYRDVLPITL